MTLDPTRGVNFRPPQRGQFSADVDKREIHTRAGLAALARCRSLLISIMTLDRAGNADTVGVLVRALLETWYFGIIVLLGDEADIARLEADNLYWKTELAKQLPDVDADPGETGKFSVAARARRAGALMPIVNEDPTAPETWYKELYAIESLVSAHAGPSSLEPYLFEDASGTIGINHDPDVADRLRYGRLLVSALMCVFLGRWVYERCGIDTGELNSIEFEPAA